jgi:hypothetical protein
MQCIVHPHCWDAAPATESLVSRGNSGDKYVHHMEQRDAWRWVTPCHTSSGFQYVKVEGISLALATIFIGS